MTSNLMPVRSTLHLLGHFDILYTGAERELLDIRRMLGKRRNVKVWSDVPPHNGYAGDAVMAIKPFDHQYPKDDVLLIGGVHMRAQPWLKYTRFDRIVLLYNLASHSQLFAMIESVREATGLEPELVFVSRLLQVSVGLPGSVVRSLMDLQPFLDVADRRCELPSRRFTVGRASRDSPDKHHPEDPALYRSLASLGIRVRVMGGTCLAEVLAGVEGVELLPAGAECMTDFLASLDVFVYRTGTSTEAYGRVVIEAMASGLPVVAHVRGGYAEAISSGESGFLFQSHEEAYDAVIALHASRELSLKVGAAGTRRAVELHGHDATERDLDFYNR